jgi:hypothetical protein
LFVFGKWSKNGQTETHLKYLGIVTTTNGNVFKILNYSWFWGLSHRATSRILIYNHKNQYVGNYYVNMIYDLPDRLVDGKLIFTNKDKMDCNKIIVTQIDFTKGLPKSLFINCDGQNGNVYSFSIE